MSSHDSQLDGEKHDIIHADDIHKGEKEAYLDPLGAGLAGAAGKANMTHLIVLESARFCVEYISMEESECRTLM